LQVLQLPELQPEQEPPVPATLVGTPPAVVVKQAKVDILRRAGLWHLGQSISLPDWLSGRSCSNLVPHSEHTYSYIGIINSPDYSLAFSALTFKTVVPGIARVPVTL
jgi:hypothetical protein